MDTFLAAFFTALLVAVLALTGNAVMLFLQEEARRREGHRAFVP